MLRAGPLPIPVKRAHISLTTYRLAGQTTEKKRGGEQVNRLSHTIVGLPTHVVHELRPHERGHVPRSQDD